MLGRLIAPYAGWVALAIVALLGLSHYYAYSCGYTAASDSYTLSAMGKAVTIREKQNEVRNHRPDNSAQLDSLRRGTF